MWRAYFLGSSGLKILIQCQKENKLLHSIVQMFKCSIVQNRNVQAKKNWFTTIYWEVTKIVTIQRVNKEHSIVNKPYVWPMSIS